MSDLNAPDEDDMNQGDDPLPDDGPVAGDDDTSPPDPMRTPMPPD